VSIQGDHSNVSMRGTLRERKSGPISVSLMIQMLSS
jgi:hypothetical protein